MPLFTYNRDIPDGPNNPSVDQPKMKTNTNSTDEIIDVDHYSFNDNSGGLHRQVNLVNEASPSILGNSVIYSNLQGGQSVPWVKNSVIDQPLFTGTVSTSASGYTSVLGGVIIQWGQVNGTHAGAFNNADTFPVVFPTPFPNFCFAVETQLGYSSLLLIEEAIIILDTASITNTGFTWTFLSDAGSTNYNQFRWMAIGF